MSRVLVLGAAGYIGLPVALAFERNGYNVSGSCINQEKANILLRNEIKPVICQPHEVDTWIPIAEESDVVIEMTSFVMISDPQIIPSTISTIARALIDLLKRKPNILVIYTSGIWVHGDTKDKTDIIDEASKTDPFPIVRWRPDLENLYTGAGACVLRPGLVYGRGGSLTCIWFHNVAAGKITFQAASLVGSVHVEDLAEAYVITARNAHVARAQLFNIVAQVESPALAFMAARNEINPALQVEISQSPVQDGSLEQPMMGTQVVDSAKARIVLGWVPTHRSFTVALPRLFAAWKAHTSHVA